MLINQIVLINLAQKFQMLVCGTKLFISVVLFRCCARLNRELSLKANVWNFPTCAAFVRILCWGFARKLAGRGC